ncbi:SRPBCC family protein [Thalassobacillus sp. CUG 92003]|uniref:SRPBCC family protein n=1 Tax=Thalassobacillus sp. CUG 92003 TaxID=2736641 RepID=UPI0015E7453B
MPFLEEQVVIKQPLSVCFERMTDFTNSPQFMENVIEVEALTEGPVREGFQFKETREIRGRKASAVIEVVSYEPNKKYTVRSEQSGIEVIYHYAFLETTVGTKIDFTGELMTKGFRNYMLKPLIKKIIKKEDQHHLEHVKAVMEKDDAN